MFTALREVLPNHPYRVLYVQTKPIHVKPLINTSNSSTTLKIRHFLTLISPKSHVLLGIEILVYFTFEGSEVTQHIFVSKCDTVGLEKSGVKVAPVVQCLISWLETYDVTRYNMRGKRKASGQSRDVQSSSFYDIHQKSTVVALRKLSTQLEDPSFYKHLPYYNDVKRKKDGRELIPVPEKQTIRICLFAKAAHEYLFPSSSKNKHKHLTGGAVLLKWWLRVLDGALDDGWKCKLIIPGADTHATKMFLGGVSNKWDLGHVFGQGVAIRSVPLFPDDPKGRFLEHLVVENRFQNMKNKTFFVELGIRQEFRLGDVVGLIGCEKTAHTRGGSDPFYSANILSVAEYKSMIQLIKSVDYSSPTEMADLVQSKIPAFFARRNDNDNMNDKDDNDNMDGVYVVVEGKRENGGMENGRENGRETVNDIGGLVKRKTVNDIGGLVKRKTDGNIKDVNDIGGLVRRREK